MSYRVIYKGLEVFCESKQELDALANGTTTPSARPRKRTEKKAPRTVKGWASNSADKQRLLLILLAGKHPAEVSDDAIRESLKLENNKKIAGIMGSLSKSARKSGLQFNSIITRDSTRNGTGERHYIYGIVPTAISELKTGLGLPE